MEEIEQYNFLCAILPVPEIIIRQVNYKKDGFKYENFNKTIIK